jgi:hypothetical protein
MEKTQNICICGNEYAHRSGLSKHRKVCRDVIIAEYKKTEENKVIVAAPVTMFCKKKVIDYLNEECNEAPNSCIDWVELIGDYFTLLDYENLIDNGISAWKEVVVKYIEELPRNKLPIRISNRQFGARFKIYYRENGKWIELEGTKATEFFFQKIIRRMGRRMGNNIKNKTAWKEQNPMWDFSYEVEKRYMTIAASFGEHFDDVVVPRFAEEIIDYFTTVRKTDDDDYI